jgi:nucleotide-binding universal stress UspA family protein
MKIMKKIICPTDFSPTANNAVEYAAKLAQKMGAELELFHAQLIYATDTVSPVIASQNMLKLSETLKRTANEVSKTFNIICNSSVESTDDELEQAISDKSSEEDTLIVMGTNGADDVFEFIFGTNSYHVIKKTKCPVLLIPEGVQFKEIKKMVFAWDYSKNNKLSFLQVKDFIRVFSPEIVFLHIGQSNSSASIDVFQTLKSEMLNYLEDLEKVSFARIYIDTPETYSERMDNYIENSNSDLLAVTYYERGFFGNLFHGGVVKGLTEIAGYPLLTLHM